jgi:hypothetical protein
LVLFITMGCLASLHMIAIASILVNTSGVKSFVRTSSLNALHFLKWSVLL